MAEETRGHLLPPAAWGRAGAHQRGILDILPEELLAVVEAAEILVLPQELDWGLGTVRLPRRHVDVVDEEHDLLVGRRAEPSLALLLELGFDEQLGVLRGRLRREVEDDVDQIPGLLDSREVVGDDDRLAHARAAGEQQGLVHVQTRLEKERETRGVQVGHQQLEEWHLLAVLERLHGFLPVFEPTLGEVDVVGHDVEVVQHGTLIRGRHLLELLDVIGKVRAGPLVKLRVEPFLEVTAQGPDVGKDENLRQLWVEAELVVGEVNPLVGLHQGLEERGERRDEVDVHGGDGLLEVLANKGQPAVDGLVEQAEDVSLGLVRHPLGKLGVRPGGDVGQPAELVGRHVHHTAPRHRGGGRHRQVLNLEEHAHGDRIELDALAVGEAQGAVVVEHGVHVLDPDGVDWAVKDDPLLLHGLVGDGVANQGGAQAVGPLARAQVVLSVELSHLDALGVEHVGVDFLERVVGVALVAKLGHRRLENLVVGRLGAARGTHEHHAETHVERLVQLDNLGDKGILGLQVNLVDRLDDGPLQVAGVALRDNLAREEIHDEVLEELAIRGEELG